MRRFATRSRAVRPEPNKFRVVMFYRRAATTLDQHKGVLDYVLSRLAEHGFTDEFAELDYMCRSGVQSFFMPCTNIHQKNHKLFEARGVKTRDLKRCAIDPAQFAMRAGARPWRSAPTPLPTGPGTREEIDAATAKLFSMTKWPPSCPLPHRHDPRTDGVDREEVRLRTSAGGRSRSQDAQEDR